MARSRLRRTDLSPADGVEQPAPAPLDQGALGERLQEGLHALGRLLRATSATSAGSSASQESK